jgi:hypothetical protein
MTELKKYIKKADLSNLVVAIQLNFSLPEGLLYEKWGSAQMASEGDWLISNNGDVYTVEETSFAKTYREVSKGLYRKVAPVWAAQAANQGVIKTKEGETHYQTGDYIVFNSVEEDESDGYAVTREKFETMYEPATE